MWNKWIDETNNSINLDISGEKEEGNLSNTNNYEKFFDNFVNLNINNDIEKME